MLVVLEKRGRGQCDRQIKVKGGSGLTWLGVGRTKEAAHEREEKKKEKD